MKSKKMAVIVMAVVAFMWIMHTFTKNFVSDPEFMKFLARKDRPLPDPALWRFMLRSHIVLALVALVTGPVGMMRKIRVKRKNVHKWNGRIYVFSIVLNVVPGLYVASFATGGWLSVIGFVILNGLWIMTTLFGYVHIRRKDIAEHTKWITRSFFLTFANLTIYVVVTIVNHVLKLPYDTSYIIAVWSSFILNLLLAELAIQKKWMH